MKKLVVDEIAKRKFEKAPNAGSSTVEGAVASFLTDHKRINFSSVYILGIVDDPNSDEDAYTYLAGPEFSTFQRVWARLQTELLWVIQKLR